MLNSCSSLVLFLLIEGWKKFQASNSRPMVQISLMVKDPPKTIYDSPSEPDLDTLATNTGQKYHKAALQRFFMLKKCNFK